MNRFLGVTMVCVILLQASAVGASARTERADGKVTEVTLYRGQAQVVREIPVTGKSGSLELVVSNLPQQLQPTSLFGEGGAGLEVRAVRYRSRAVGDAPVKAIAELDGKIQKLQDDLALIEQKKQLVDKRNAYLDKLENFVASTAKTDQGKGALNAESLQQITLFCFEQREQAAAESIKLRREEREFRKDLELLQRKRNEITRGSSKTLHEAVLFLEKTGNADQRVRLTYLVSGCGWNPAYNFRADSKENKVAVEYNALIRQMSGENWDRVKLTLSTATPQLSAAAPGLAPFRVMLARGEDPNRKLSEVGLKQKANLLIQRQRGFTVSQQNTIGIWDNLRANWSMNAGANDYQLLELCNGAKKLAVLQQVRLADADGPSLSYRMDTPVSLASRNDQQMIRIMRKALNSRLYHVAIPVLSGNVYREAGLQNTTDVDLLSGQVSMYLDGRFVGRSEIPTVARGQKFVVGFGADPQLRTSRELVKREETTRGGNLVVKFDYRLVVENYKRAKLPVRVMERLPYTPDNKDLNVTLAAMTDKLSKDPLYLRLEEPKGILRWDIEAPAEASGAEARMVNFSYELEYARDHYLANPMHAQATDQLPAQQDEFFELQKNRLKQ